jgi:hypothetical protein
MVRASRSCFPWTFGSGAHYQFRSDVDIVTAAEPIGHDSRSGNYLEMRILPHS